MSLKNFWFCEALEYVLGFLRFLSIPLEYYFKLTGISEKTILEPLKNPKNFLTTPLPLSLVLPAWTLSKNKFIGRRKTKFKRCSWLKSLAPWFINLNIFSIISIFFLILWLSSLYLTFFYCLSAKFQSNLYGCIINMLPPFY